MKPGRRLALAAVAALTLSSLPLASGSAADEPDAPGPEAAFHRLATYPVFQNVPDGVDPAAPTVAEISAVTEDGKTVIYTDALGRRAGFLDITDPANPTGLGSIDLTQTGSSSDEPTSVAVVGEHLLVAVDESAGNYTDPQGRLDVFTIADRELAHSFDLGGQPDSIAVSPDKAYAAIAIENQRDEGFTPDGGEEGDLPQLPAGYVQVLELDGAPSAWPLHDVLLTEEDGSPLSALADAGIVAPEDPEPEYVDINGDNLVAVTLQENNGVVTIDLATRDIVSAFSAGNAVVTGIDTVKDGLFDLTGSIDLPREPDALAWVGDNLVATANEGDWRGGTRGWSVFDATTGEVVWDAGNSFEHLATRLGLHNNDRAGKKGSEPEGLTFDVIGGTPYAFVGSERSNFVAVYDMTDPTEPQLVQALATTNGPEGLLTIPSRDLLVVSSEHDNAAANVRASVGVYELGSGTPAFPSVVSGDEDALPIGWGALSALSVAPGQADRLWAASDSAYRTGRIYGLDLATTPAVIDQVIEVTDSEGAMPELDIEGLAARPDGGFWVADEGATGPGNRLLRTDDDGVILETVELPGAVATGLGKWGLEGVTTVGTGAGEQVYVALQRPLAGESSARIGRYDVATQVWTWFGYPLETTDVPGDWIGLSEITALGGSTFAVIERDKLNGPRAAVKRIYTVDIPSGDPTTVTPLTKELAVDVLPEMEALNGWTQEKIEGFAVTDNGRFFVVNDNDALVDSTGETQLIELEPFAVDEPANELQQTRTVLKATKKKVVRGKAVRLVARVRPGKVAVGRVEFVRRGKVIAAKNLDESGRAKLKVTKLKVGKHRFKVRFLGSEVAHPSTSNVVKVRVVRRR